MEGRTFVVIFFFWAALTVITPTLVLWSESSKPELEFNGQKSEGIKDRKMIGYAVKQVSNATKSSTQLEAAATTGTQNWSWLQELESCVSKVFRKAMGLLIRVS
ncbi:Uncharacterized protein TCM_034070 [Theobroma cacao]|uniref:Uncharacterized protein n=1 Tax=Theobroma cacao TaxID=3641 RepID=A0A061FJY2_THECC|nr:Uncharacterized protein TCM_034070 [Theobroma cacao]